ncbi:MAG: aminotransferase class I/II-fold pyridoxal phosphate-dependent enzyme [Clostridia bacterium]|nr:aminotransferase class I/II-fold pyridoxal phosphate-dependent enzyme [Clostridia bacterium]MBQ8859670.1 aminotransferase class I/II-fold pyridoxal phosphate-dependent enzyme [Clostridia bacterium]
MEKLAILGGTPALPKEAPKELFHWPIITEEDEAAALEIIRTNNFSGTDITTKFQDEFAAWQGRRHALAYTNGTMSIAAALFAIGLGAGDEIICPTKTYWASITAAQWLGATAVFCAINNKMSLDPDDLERCITKRTKAIMVVHYHGYPADMDRIMEIANRHNLIVIEDVSHAQGGLYKGKKLGNFGHIAAMSMMSGKAFAAGEMGMLVTDDTRLYERALAYGHYERNNESFIKESEELKPYFHIAIGGVKGRVNQLCAALGRGQLKHFDERTAEIRRAMNYFFDQIEKIPGLSPLRVDESTGSTMGGFYHPHCIYDPAAFHGLSVKRFAKAVMDEFNGTAPCWDGSNYCLHTHNYFKTFDGFHLGKPSRIAFADANAVPEDDVTPSLAASVEVHCFSVPWFKKLNKEWIDRYVAAIRKVVDQHEALLEEDDKSEQGGRWYGATNEDVQQKKKN